jgi:hypothetical protein
MDDPPVGSHAWPLPRDSPGLEHVGAEPVREDLHHLRLDRRGTLEQRRNARSVATTIRTFELVVTVAVRGRPEMSAISPRKSPP